MKPINWKSLKLRYDQEHKLRHLEQLLKPYKKYWNRWIRQPECTLTPKEIQFISLYRKSGSIQKVSDQMSVTNARASQLYRAVTEQRICHQSTFLVWKKNLEGQVVQNPNPEPTHKEQRYKCLVCQRILNNRTRHTCKRGFKNPGKWEKVTVVINEYAY